ncbi:MAG: glutathione S-transferase family protein [Gammaproteobacteria bacterium]|nr:glutathione S-transferase [Gammaproteobacteria bacterium]
MTETIVFYTNPMSRGQVAHWMLEEVGAPYQTKILDFEKREHKSPEYLAINPMGKVPAIVDRGVVVTEVPAICAYLADAFPEAGLAPDRDDPLRGTYYRWLFFAAGCLEAAVIDKAFARPAVKESVVGYGTYENTLNALESALTPGPYLLGERFSAADVYVGAQIRWGLMQKTIERRPVFEAYVARLEARPVLARVSRTAS